MRTFLTSVILLFVSTALSAADPLAERMESGLRALQSGELEKAAAVYLEILTSNPRYTAARHLLGVCQLQMGRMADGIRSLEVVRKENPQNRQAEYTLVSTYVALSMFDEAQKIVDTTLRTDRTAEACFMRGSYRMARADYEGAIRELETARKMNPKLPGVRSMLGVTYGFANRSDQAIPMLEAALKENARDGNAAAFLGWLYKERDRGSEATTLLEQTVRERPGDFGALFGPPLPAATAPRRRSQGPQRRRPTQRRSASGATRCPVDFVEGKHDRKTLDVLARQRPRVRWCRARRH